MSESTPAGGPVHGGYTHDELQAAFNLVKTPGNWKLPVDAVIDADVSRNLVSAAIAHFTGSPAEFIRLPDERVQVLAAGYYACIGA